MAGFAAMRSPIAVYGVSVRHPRQKQEDMVFDLACRTADHLGQGGVVKRDMSSRMMAMSGPAMACRPRGWWTR